MAEAAKKGPGRPRKTPKAEPVAEAVESEAPAEVPAEPAQVEAPEPQAAPKTELEARVDRLMDLVKGFTPNFNKQQKLSVINLGQKATPQGMKYRQLFVEETPGNMVISIHEGFNSAHGGAAQRDKLNEFVVPVSEVQLYSRVHKRFFGDNPTKNLNEATLLLDKLEQTVRN